MKIQDYSQQHELISMAGALCIQPKNDYDNTKIKRFKNKVRRIPAKGNKGSLVDKFA